MDPQGKQNANGRLTQAERTEISDNRMLEAAVELISTVGPAATSLKEVGMKAGYSRGLAGQRFGSKDNLFAFVLRQVGEVWLGQLKRSTSREYGLGDQRGPGRTLPVLRGCTHSGSGFLHAVV